MQNTEEEQRAAMAVLKDWILELAFEKNYLEVTLQDAERPENVLPLQGDVVRHRDQLVETVRALTEENAKLRWAAGYREGVPIMGPDDAPTRFVLPDGSWTNSCGEARDRWFNRAHDIVAKLQDLRMSALAGAEEHEPEDRDGLLGLYQSFFQDTLVLLNELAPAQPASKVEMPHAESNP